MADLLDHRQAAAAQAGLRPEPGASTLPEIRIRGRNFMALVIQPESPLAGWFSAFDLRLVSAPAFFADRPVVANLSAALAEGGREAVLIVLDGLEARSLRLVGVEGVDPRVLAGTRWARLPKALQGREMALEVPASAPLQPDPPPAAPEPAPAAPSLLVDRPVRSGQSIVFADGDVIVVGTVSSGAEVIAGGSIHVYGSLRGRAIAGLRVGEGARIFCRKLEAEMVGVDQLYRTAEHWGVGLHGRPVQVRCDRGTLRLTPFD